MQSLYRFIVKPKHNRYNNIIKVGNKDLIVNTKLETFQAVSKEATVVSLPKLYKGSIQVGDNIIIHHNVFRKFYDVRGKIKNSASYFKNDLFFCDLDQIYLYKNIDKWICNLNYCFVSPIKETDNFKINKEKELTGIIKYTNSYLLKKNIDINTLVTFTPNSEFEFVFNGERLYCMKSNDIALTHEHKGNEEKYNPSWAHSS
jgi:hypothetical protein